MENPNMKLRYEQDAYGEDNHGELTCGEMVVGMIYTPLQMWREVRDPQEALGRGTQFAELDKPFFGEDVWGCE